VLLMNADLRDRIKLAPGFVPRSQCEEIILSISPDALCDAAILSGVNKEVRNVLAHDTSSVRRQVNATMQRIVVELIEPAYGIQIDYWELPEIIIYPVGGFYVCHVDGEGVEYDNERRAWAWRRNINRDISVVWYLNEEFEGGELVFPKFEVSIRPTTGLVVMFPSTHDYPHGTKPVTKGVRYAVVSWMAAIGTPRTSSAPAGHVRSGRRSAVRV
jgi:predicted 2-oxoglutarate/Fe(II)-dependent dioxygenase YbiX